MNFISCNNNYSDNWNFNLYKTNMISKDFDFSEQDIMKRLIHVGEKPSHPINA